MNGFVSVLPEKLKNGVFLLLEREGAPFVSLQYGYLEALDQGQTPLGRTARTLPPLSAKRPFVKFDLVDSELNNNHKKPLDK